MQYAVDLRPRREVNTVKLRDALEFQAPVVRDAALTAHRQLDRLGIRHAFAGGLAVGAHGYVRATDDVDFLVAEDAFEEHEGGIVTFRPGVPIDVGGVRIDYLTVANLGPAARAALQAPETHDGLPVVSLEALVTMKLAANRMRDRADVTELLKRGADAARIRASLEADAGDLLERFDALVAQAMRES